MIKIILHVFYVALFISFNAYGCGLLDNESLAKIEFDYRLYMKNADLKLQDEYIVTDSNFDFVRSFPEGDYKRTIAADLEAAVPSSTLLASVQVGDVEDKLIINLISWSCGGVSGFMRSLSDSANYSEVKLIKVEPLEDSKSATNNIVEVRLLKNVNGEK